MTNPKEEYKNGPILSNDEITNMLKKADQIKDEYYKLRVKALIALLKKWGKRRIEIARLKRSDLQIINDYLHITFTIAKKHKKGVYQYLEKLKKSDPQALQKPYSDLVSEWQFWTLTQEGFNVKEERREKRVSTQDRYAKNILEYLDYLDKNYPEAEYLFPSGTPLFGIGYIIRPNRHLTGRQLLRLIKDLNPEAWMHLFRETKGAEIARDMGDTLASVFEVKNTWT